MIEDRGDSRDGNADMDGDDDSDVSEYYNEADDRDSSNGSNGGGGSDHAAAADGASDVAAEAAPPEDDDFEEECVICLEELRTQPWGRCTPCNHAFHKQCWWDWENAHAERVDQKRRRGNRVNDEGAKCCLCNTVNRLFVDGTDASAPAHNPSPYVASDDPGDAGGGSRFANWFREVGEEASGFMDFLQSELRDQWGPFMPRGSFNRGRSNNGGGGSSSNNTAGPRSNNNRRRSSSFTRPFFGSRSDSSRSASPNDRRGAAASSNARGSGAAPPFVPPFFRNRFGSDQGQQAWASYVNNNGNSGGNPFNQLRPGTQIVTQNLVSSPHLNRKRGVVLQYQPQSGRYLVQLQSDISSFIAGDSSPVAIRPENLLQAAQVRIHGLRSQPGLNGREGTVCAYSSQRNRYVVRVEESGLLSSSAREISIQPTNIRIPSGTCVRLEGLENASQWNGRYGTIVRWVEAAGGGPGRYEVCLSRQYGVRVKMENVRL